MATRRYLAYPAFCDALLGLRNHFVKPHPKRPVPTNADLRRGDDFLVASHAAIQSFIEEGCRLSLQASLWRLKMIAQPNQLLTAMSDAAERAYVSLLSATTYNFLTDLNHIERGVKWYVKRLDDNNGVKRANLFALLLPLGFVESNFDPVWLSALDAFGSQRGDVAHGRAAAITKRRAPSITLSGQTKVLSAWSQRSTKPRAAAQAPWDIDTQLYRLLPELRAWDARLLDASRRT